MDRQLERESARGREREPRRRGKDEIIFASPDRADFKEMFPGVFLSVLWGDPDVGAHGAFTRMEPGFDAGTHTHTNDVWIVVLKGAYLYKDASGEKRVGPGEFLRIPGGCKHWSGGDTTEGTLFYQESSGKFDLVPLE